MKTNRLRLGFTRITDKRLIPFAKGIIENMTGNVPFATTADLLAEVVTAYDEYLNAIPARNLRNSFNSAVKNEKKKVLIQKLKSLGYLIESIANGSIELLESTGYELANKGQSKGELGKPTGIRAKTNGIEDMAIFQCDNNVGANIYEARVSSDGASWNKFGASPNRTVKVKGLTVGEDLFVQMRMTNVKGEGPWSGSVSFYIPKLNAAIAMA